MCKLRNGIRRAINWLGFDIVQLGPYRALKENKAQFENLSRWMQPSVHEKLRHFILDNVHISHSQIHQDLLALYIYKEVSTQSNSLRSPFFVEFGATDGMTLSNSYLLEKNYGWNGILCEPAEKWHSRLKANRTSIIDFRCVYTQDDLQLEFLETKIGELSTIAKFKRNDYHSSSRHGGRKYNVQTVSLNTLLVEKDAPKYIDLLSVDTEGSEYEILSKLNFDVWQFGLIAVEHNYKKERESIFELLRAAGYIRILSDVSSWDDWYILEKHQNLLFLENS
jgi:FkbM family methyltransferase